jgi:uncharacterized protein
MKHEIEELKKLVHSLATEQGLYLIVLFGSQATGKVHLHSDIDLAVLKDKKLSPLEIAKLQLEFIEVLGEKNVEVVDLKQASPLLLRQIADQGKLLFEKEESSYSLFKLSAYKKHMEAGYLYKLKEESLNKFLRNT